MEKADKSRPIVLTRTLILAILNTPRIEIQNTSAVVSDLSAVVSGRSPPLNPDKVAYGIFLVSLGFANCVGRSKTKNEILDRIRFS